MVFHLLLQTHKQRPSYRRRSDKKFSGTIGETECNPAPTEPPPTIPPVQCARPICTRCGTRKTTTSNSCTECRACSTAKPCPEILCLAQTCNYGQISPVINGTVSKCCLGCPTCQVFPSSECKDIACDPNIQCGPGDQLVNQVDAAGCELCPTCKSGCPFLKCPAPACDACEQAYRSITPTGCSGCDVCLVRPDFRELEPCDYVRIANDTGCPEGIKHFAYVSTDSIDAECCRVSRRECLPPHCPYLYCKNPECSSEAKTKYPRDANGCPKCPYCI